MFCANCGEKIGSGRAKFCPFCGEIIEKESKASSRSEKPAGSKRFRLPVSRRTKVILSAVGAALLIIAIVIGLHAAGLGSWKCDRCDKEWFGGAYKGKYAGSVICGNCAEDYWSPRPLEDYRLEANW